MRIETSIFDTHVKTKNRFIPHQVAELFSVGAAPDGKSTLLKETFSNALYYDLLLASDFRRLLHDPGILRQECEARHLTGTTQTAPILIDEVQKLPELLDEVQ